MIAQGREGLYHVDAKKVVQAIHLGCNHLVLLRSCRHTHFHVQVWTDRTRGDAVYDGHDEGHGFLSDGAVDASERGHKHTQSNEPEHRFCLSVIVYKYCGWSVRTVQKKGVNHV